MSVPPVYKKWTQYNRICSCGRRKAVFQRDKEEKVTLYLSQGMSLEEANIKWLKENNITSICCLRDYTYPEKNQIYDIAIGALTDITTYKAKPLNENWRTGDNSGNAGYEFLFKTRGVIDFNMAQYSTMLVSLSRSNFDKMEILRNESVGTNNKLVPQFPNYFVTRSENLPTILPEKPLLTLSELTLQNLTSN